jgi:predicted nucleic acid-binding protein
VTIVVDASTIINLVNSGCLQHVLALKLQIFLVSKIVRTESKSVAALVDVLIATQAIHLIDDSLISASEFAQAKVDWKLDDGETECIIAARKLNFIVATDDGLARRRVQLELGLDRLIGSIGLLRCAVDEKLIIGKDAFLAYKAMKAAGGFLPDISSNVFGC